MRRKDREVTDMEEIIKIMKKCEVCSIALNDEGAPYIVPMNFGLAVKGDQIELYFHGAKVGKKMDLLREHQQVAFEMHCSTKLLLNEVACESSCEFESVCGNGQMQILGEEEKIEALTILMRQYDAREHYTFSDRDLAAVAVMKLVVKEISGKRKIVSK